MVGAGADLKEGEAVPLGPDRVARDIGGVALAVGLEELELPAVLGAPGLLRRRRDEVEDEGDATTLEGIVVAKQTIALAVVLAG